MPYGVEQAETAARCGRPRSSYLADPNASSTTSLRSAVHRGGTASSNPVRSSGELATNSVQVQRQPSRGIGETIRAALLCADLPFIPEILEKLIYDRKSFNIDPLRKKRWLATPGVFQDAVGMATSETTPCHPNLLTWSVGLCSLSCPLHDVGFARRDFHRLAIPVERLIPLSQVHQHIGVADEI
jgi:hypothetical protein